MGVKYEIKGNGYVKSQSVKDGEVVGDDITVILNLDKGS
jgi:hypothetical protein